MGNGERKRGWEPEQEREILTLFGSMRRVGIPKGTKQ